MCLLGRVPFFFCFFIFWIVAVSAVNITAESASTVSHYLVAVFRLFCIPHWERPREIVAGRTYPSSFRWRFVFPSGTATLTRTRHLVPACAVLLVVTTVTTGSEGVCRGVEGVIFQTTTAF